MTDKILNILVEGQTEELFVSQMLKQHLWEKNSLIVNVRKINSKGGGYTKYSKTRTDIVLWARQEPHHWLTSMIDFYGLKNDFPGYEVAKSLPYERKVDHIEAAFGADIKHEKFIPYIQLHEFEALLFSKPEKIEECLRIDNSSFDVNAFTRILNDFDGDPEKINDHPQTAPSKRINAICPGFQKTLHGILTLEDIGLKIIRQKCKHFNSWLTRLEQL